MELGDIMAKKKSGYLNMGLGFIIDLILVLILIFVIFEFTKKDNDNTESIVMSYMNM